jgi:hypothetical protein
MTVELADPDDDSTGPFDTAGPRAPARSASGSALSHARPELVIRLPVPVAGNLNTGLAPRRWRSMGAFGGGASNNLPVDASTQGRLLDAFGRRQ